MINRCIDKRHNEPAQHPQTVGVKAVKEETKLMKQIKMEIPEA